MNSELYANIIWTSLSGVLIILVWLLVKLERKRQKSQKSNNEH